MSDIMQKRLSEMFIEATTYARKMTEPVIEKAIELIEEGLPDLAITVLRTHLETERLLCAELEKQRARMSDEQHNQMEHELHREDPTP